MKARRTRPWTTLPAAAACLAVGACGGAEGVALRPGAPEWCTPLEGGPGFAVADSAGVQIVTSVVPAWGEPLVVLGPAPALTLGEGTNDPAYEFARVAGATRLPDGRLVVADAQTAEVKSYDAEGRFLARAGGRGSGPGEYMFISGLLGVGDSVLVVDGGARRVTWLDPALGVIRTEPLAFVSFTRPASTPDGRALSGSVTIQLRGRFADGSFLGAHSDGFSRPQPTETHVSRQGLVLWRMPSSGELGDSLGATPAGESFQYFFEGGFTFGDALLGHVESLAVAPEGFFAGTGEHFEIVERGPDGRIQRLIRLCEGNDPITPEDVEREIERRLASMTEAQVAFEEPAFRGIPHPTVAPAYLDLQVDGRGRLWARDFTVPGEPSRWKVFAPGGRWLGEALTPPDLVVLEIGEDHLLARHTDPLGVQSVRLYRIDLPEN